MTRVTGNESEPAYEERGAAQERGPEAMKCGGAVFAGGMAMRARAGPSHVTPSSVLGNTPGTSSQHSPPPPSISSLSRTCTERTTCHHVTTCESPVRHTASAEPHPAMPAHVHAAVERTKFDLTTMLAKARKYAPPHIRIVVAESPGERIAA